MAPPFGDLINFIYCLKNNTIVVKTEQEWQVLSLTQPPGQDISAENDLMNHNPYKLSLVISINV